MNQISDFYIFKMESWHLDTLLELENKCFSLPWTKKMFLEEISNENAFYFVALKNEKVIGYAGMWIVLDEGQITNIAVHPAYRNFGIAKKLIEKLLEASIGRGVTGLTLEVRRSNYPAIALYVGAGFMEEGIRKAYYRDNGEDAIIMWKKLNS